MDLWTWVERNILLLDPGVDQASEGGPETEEERRRALNVQAEQEEDLSKLLQLVPCSVHIGGDKRDLKVRCSKTPVDAIVLCRLNGEQMTQLAANTILSVNRLTERRVGVIFAKPGATPDDVKTQAEADFEFRSAAACRQFVQALEKLFGLEILDPLKDKKRKWDLQATDDVNVIATVVMQGSGAFDETFKLEYTSKAAKTTSSKERIFPFVAISWIVSETIGGVNRTFKKEAAVNKNEKTLQLNALMAGRFVQAEVDVDRKALDNKKDKTHYRVTKGPIIPSVDLTTTLLDVFCSNSTRWLVTLKGKELSSVVSMLYQVPSDIRTAAKAWKSTLNTDMILTSRGFKVVIPGFSSYNGFYLQWNECLADLPSPLNEKGELHKHITRDLAYGTIVSFLDPSGTNWISLSVQFTGQKERDAFWHTAMFFLLNKDTDQSTFYQWELNRTEGNTSDLQNKFRDVWLALGRVCQGCVGAMCGWLA
eukprot:Blabericola_migrator_1__535@NODE_1130_length_5336_cov_152_365534_g770_i0_p2_GENE_NODE_1130_length_5336_cov_152_365534_g770_i0NODE_1130_length_5336_cov_152_365534_g770_i0_p2_ORF_typecomplete_len480_score96_59_NODE_1130_length_5336_cov_152_365534_g770_i04631902